MDLKLHLTKYTVLILICCSAVTLFAADNNDSVSLKYSVKVQGAKSLSEPNQVKTEPKSSEIDDLLNELNSLQFPKQKYIEQTDMNVGKVNNNDNAADENNISAAINNDDVKNLGKIDDLLNAQTQNLNNPADPGINTSQQNQGILSLLQSISQDDESVSNPLDLARIIYIAGYQTQAARFYKIALIRLKSSEPFYNETKAWILFQLGNCFRASQKDKAIAYYSQLIEEYPNSTWSAFAKFEIELAQLYENEIGQSLLDELEANND